MTEKEKVLEMLENGTINSQEAMRLLSCLEPSDPKRAAPLPTEMQGKKLRVKVDGHTEKEGKINVNVSMPLVLARHVDNIIANCVPDVAQKELKAQGIDLRSINLSQIIDTIESIEEDIVNVDIKQEDDDVNLTVRVYVE